jgi:hypothetical protein
MPDCIGEDGPEEANGATCGAFAAAHAGPAPVRRGLEPNGRLSGSNIMHELVDIFSRNCRDLVLTKKGLDMALYTPAISRKGTRLFRSLAAG